MKKSLIEARITAKNCSLNMFNQGRKVWVLDKKGGHAKVHACDWLAVNAMKDGYHVFSYFIDGIEHIEIF